MSKLLTCQMRVSIRLSEDILDWQKHFMIVEYCSSFRKAKIREGENCIK